MRFTESVRTVLRQKYATFTGRASRSEFWWFQLFFMLMLLAYFLILMAFGFSQELLSPGQSYAPDWLTIPAFLIILALIIPLLALQVRRFHDHNLSGWWYLLILLMTAIPYLGPLISLAILALFMVPGTAGPNRFGPDPRNPEVTADIFA